MGIGYENEIGSMIWFGWWINNGNWLLGEARWTNKLKKKELVEDLLQSLLVYYPTKEFNNILIIISGSDSSD